MAVLSGDFRFMGTMAAGENRISSDTIFSDNRFLSISIAASLIDNALTGQIAFQ